MSAITTRGQQSWWRRYGEPLLLVASLASFGAALAAGWRDRFPDFEIFRASANLWQRGLDPYAGLASLNLGPNTNNPAVVLAFVPFAMIPFRLASLAWLALSLGALFVTARTAAPVATRTVCAVVLVSQAGVLVVRQGQLAFALSLILTLAWMADRRGNEWRAGAWLGVLVFAKPFYGVYAVSLLTRRAWTTLTALATSFFLCVAVGFVAGSAAYRGWLNSLAGINWQGHTVNASLWGLATRLFANPPTQPYVLTTSPLHPSAFAQWTVWIGLAAIVIVVTGVALRTAPLDRRWALLSIVSVLLSPLGELHYLPVGLAPLVATALAAPRWATLGIVILVLSVPSAVISGAPAGPLATATIGSWSTWSTLWLWAWLVLQDGHPHPTRAVQREARQEIAYE